MIGEKNMYIIKNPEAVRDKIDGIFDKLQLKDDYRLTTEEVSLIKEAAMLDLLTASQLRGFIAILCDEYIVRPAYTSE